MLCKKTIMVFALVMICAGVFAKTTSITKKKLSNDIPVYIQQNKSNKILALYIVVQISAQSSAQHGTVLLTPDKSGLENALFSMMTRGSEKYPYAKIQSLEYSTKASLSPGTLDEGSILGLSCIDYYFDTMFPVLVDGFMHPAFGTTEYNTLLNEYSQRLQTIQNDPNSLLQYNAEKVVYKGHPYETSTGVTEESLPNITVDNMKSLLSDVLDARRISVVAVGNFDEKKLLQKLNETLGTIAASPKKFTPAQVPPVTVEGAPIVYTHPAAEGTGFLAQVFTSPSVQSADYVTSCIASNMYSELLYNIVREKYGACYTPSSAVMSSEAPVGMIYIYKASDIEHIRSYVKEAQQLMEQGKLISGKKDDGTYSFTTIDDRLEGYINSYLNEKYEGMQTNGGVAGKIAGSILQFNDPEKYLSVMESARKVTAKDIERVFNTYWCTDKVQWFAVVGPADKEKTELYLK